jgi:hypothetical protein
VVGEFDGFALYDEAHVGKFVIAKKFGSKLFIFPISFLSVSGLTEKI